MSIIAVKTKIDGKVVDIKFYTWETLPARMKALSLKQGLRPVGKTTKEILKALSEGLSNKEFRQFFEDMKLLTDDMSIALMKELVKEA